MWGVKTNLAILFNLERSARRIRHRACGAELGPHIGISVGKVNSAEGHGGLIVCQETISAEVTL
jgi:hypothetical protein